MLFAEHIRLSYNYYQCAYFTRNTAMNIETNYFNNHRHITKKETENVG